MLSEKGRDNSRYHTYVNVAQALRQLTQYCTVTVQPSMWYDVRVKGCCTNTEQWVEWYAKHNDVAAWPNYQQPRHFTIRAHGSISASAGHRQIVLTKVSKYNVDEAVFLSGDVCLASDEFEDGIPRGFKVVISHHYATVSRTMTFRSIDQFVKAAWMHFKLPHGDFITGDWDWDDIKPL